MIEEHLNEKNSTNLPKNTISVKKNSANLHKKTISMNNLEEPPPPRGKQFLKKKNW